MPNGRLPFRKHENVERKIMTSVTYRLFQYIGNIKYQLAILSFGILKGTALAVLGKFSLSRCGDESGYILFDLSSLTAVFENMRTLGFPIVIRFYELFFNQYDYWPIFHYCIFVIAVVVLLSSMMSAGIPAIVSFAMSFGILIMGPNVFLSSICTEPIAMSFVLLAISMMLNFTIKPNLSRGAALLCLSACIWIIRPGFAAFALFLPILVLMIKNRTGLPRLGLFALSGFTVSLPLALYVALRFIVVGDIGIAPFSNWLLSGHTAGYLRPYHIPQLPESVRPFALDILERRPLINSNCGAPETPYSVNPGRLGNWLPPISRVRFENECFPALYHLAISTALEHNLDKQIHVIKDGHFIPYDPSIFSDAPLPKTLPVRNWPDDVNGWMLQNFERQNISSQTIDRYLGKFNRAVIDLSRPQYNEWRLFSPVIGLKSIAIQVFDNFVITAGLISAFCMYLAFAYYRRKDFDRWQDMLTYITHSLHRILPIIFYGIFSAFLTVLLTLQFAYIYDRYIDGPIFLFSGLSWALAAHAFTLINPSLKINRVMKNE